MFLHKRHSRVALEGERAIIDIGSNTVRLVVFDGPARAPRVVINEKVSAKLGKGVYETGALAPKASQAALAALSRFALLLQARRISDVETVATAAPRDAANGPEFLAAIAQLGLNPRLLTGEEEALVSAQGVIGAFPEAKGVVADLGGGSLELVHIAGSKSDHGTSLPFGSLRLPALGAAGPEKFNRSVRKAVAESGFECAPEETLYLVGGSHRALARYAMHREEWPLDDPHGYSLTREAAISLCRSLRSGYAPLPVPGLSSSRSASLPHTAALLSELIREIQPSHIVFSSWGLREGLHFARLDEDVQAQNPLIAGIADFVARQGVSPAVAAIVAGWTVEASNPGPDNHEYLRLAATMLALASQRIEPNLRAELAVDWALRKRWVGINAEGKAMLAACILAHCGSDPLRADLARLASPASLSRAAAWGSAIRLCRRLSGGATALLERSSLTVEQSELVLTVDPSIAALLNEAAEKDHRNLAQRLGLVPILRIEPA